MKLELIAFTAQGAALAARLAQALSQRGHQAACTRDERLSAAEWASRAFARSQGLIFVGAAGIAVRSTPIVYDPELYVLKHTKAPAVLLENGFHTNREEAALLGQADYRQKLAVAEAKGILEYLGIPWVETEEETDYQAEARAAVDWLTENGIMQGNAEGDLMLDQPLTRRQFAVLEYRIAKLEGFV